MIRRTAIALLALSCVFACERESAPGSFERFLSVAGGRLEEMCADASNGKRFWLDGYLQLPDSFTIDEGEASLDFYASLDRNGEGAGRTIRIDVKSPGDIDDLWASAQGKKTAGFRREEGQIDPNALRIRTTEGTAGPRDRIRLTFDVNAIKHFQTNQITACTYQFVEAEKL